MSQVSTLLNLAEKIKEQCDRFTNSRIILELLLLLERCHNRIEPYCTTQGCRDYLNIIKAKATEIKTYLVNRPNLAKQKAAELLEAAKKLAEMGSLQRV